LFRYCSNPSQARSRVTAWCLSTRSNSRISNRADGVVAEKRGYRKPCATWTQRGEIRPPVPADRRRTTKPHSASRSNPLSEVSLCLDLRKRENVCSSWIVTQPEVGLQASEDCARRATQCVPVAGAHACPLQARDGSAHCSSEESGLDAGLEGKTKPIPNRPTPAIKVSNTTTNAIPASRNDGCHMAKPQSIGAAAAIIILNRT
jgi:hypothetical protein